MITLFSQRWKLKRGLYRPADEVINTRQYEVASIPGDSLARAFVESHHYAHSYPAARFRYGLYHQGELVGVAVFSHPTNDKVLSIFPGETKESVELGRFVLLDSVPGNGETWFLAQAFHLLKREGITGVVSFSDPIPRLALDGTKVFAGHIGRIYQAHNAHYLGRATKRTLALLPDGTVLNARTISKIRTLERGWEYSAGQLVSFGANPLNPSIEDPREWLQKWMKRLTRPLRHPGNFKYGWGLSRAVKKHCEKHWHPEPYPKFTGVRSE